MGSSRVGSVAEKGVASVAERVTIGGHTDSTDCLIFMRLHSYILSNLKASERAVKERGVKEPYANPLLLHSMSGANRPTFPHHVIAVF